MLGMISNSHIASNWGIKVNLYVSYQSFHRFHDLDWKP